MRGMLAERVSSYRLLTAFLGLNIPLILLILMRNLDVGGLTRLSWLYVSTLAIGYYGLPLLVVVTTDHAESFNEQQSNFWGHGSNFTANQIHVPFILHAPGRAPERVERRTSHIDLAPTLLQDYFGCEADASVYSNGRSLFDESPAPRPLVIGSYVSHAFLFGDDVYEIMLAYTKKYKLNDLHAEASPPPPDMLKTVMGETNRFLSR
jgi:membrane-anchored protein YejM (alkaline phosphatase superfamily)